MMRDRFGSEAGAALVLVLSLVALMSMIAIVAVDAAAMGLRRTKNLEAMAQARWRLVGAELSARAMRDDIERLSAKGQIDQADWQGRVVSFPLDDGVMTIALWDGVNCFNLNSLIEPNEEGVLGANVTAQVQFARIVAASDSRAAAPMALAAALTDWIDPDAVTGPNGAEDDAYTPLGRRTANQKLGDVRELLNVRGFSLDLVNALKPSVCVRPNFAPNTINPNTLRPDQAAFLTAMVGPALPLTGAESLLRNRPRGGWKSLDDFFAEPVIVQANLSEQMKARFKLSSKYFVMAGAVRTKKGRETVQSLIDMAPGSRVVRRIYGVSVREPVL